MKWISSDEITKLIEYVRSKIGNQSSNAIHKIESIPDQVGKLSKLKDQGILTEEEFKNKKKELLARL